MTPDEQKRIQKWHDTLQSAYLTAKDWEEAKATWMRVMREMQDVAGEAK